MIDKLFSKSKKVHETKYGRTIHDISEERQKLVTSIEFEGNHVLTKSLIRMVNLEQFNSQQQPSNYNLSSKMRSQQLQKTKRQKKNLHVRIVEPDSNSSQISINKSRSRSRSQRIEKSFKQQKESEIKDMKIKKKLKKLNQFTYDDVYKLEDFKESIDFMTKFIEIHQVILRLLFFVYKQYFVYQELPQKQLIHQINIGSQLQPNHIDEILDLSIIF